MKLPNLVPQTVPMEDQVMRGMYDDVSRDPWFVDLRPAADDKTILKTPHKGWFWHYVDNGMRRGQYRDRQAPGDYMEDFPCLNHLYLRFDWSDIEREKGVYDWSPLDRIMEEWGPHGYTFSMRACCFEGDQNVDFATPRYVFEDGARCYDTGWGIQPDYGDPIFLERLEAFMEQFGKRYNGDKRLELIDVGTYGTWGEGHTVQGDGVIYPMDVVKKHLDLHAKYFPDTLLLCNDDHIIGRMAHGADEVNEMLRFADARGFGVQDDSICCDGYSVDMGYDTMRANWAFQKLYRNAPSTIEFAHYTYIRPEFDRFYRNGYTIIECLKNSRATFAGFHGYPRVWLKNEHDLADYCANRLGYWWFIPSVSVPPMQNSAHNVMSLRIENRGWGKAYHKYDLKIRLTGANGRKVCASDYDLRLLGPGEGADIRVPLDLRGLAAGEYEVAVGVFEGNRPVRLALKQELEKDGFYTVAKTAVTGV